MRFASFFAVLACLIWAHLSFAFAEEISGENIKVELVSEYDALRPGKEEMVAVRMKPENDWHLYWKYHGDTGAPPKIVWDKVEGLSFGEILWPFPEKITIGHLVNYGYAEEVLLLVPLKISENEKRERLNLKAKVSWLVCLEECIPGTANLNLDLKISPDANESGHFEKFKEARKKLPVRIPDLKITAEKIEPDHIVLKLIESPGINNLKTQVEFIPDSGRQIENAAEQTTSIEGESLVLKLTKAKTSAFPEKISGILVSFDGWSENYPQALEVAVPIRQGTVSNDGKSLIWSIAFAFLGGIILNLMPCVFPILSIKILGFVNKGTKEDGKAYKHGISFAFGVLVSFWILAGLLIGLQSAGFKLGWGFQLQSPLFLSIIIVLLFLVGLNFYGFIEFGGRLQNFFGKFSLSGYSDSFLSGVLATVLATPCTAPFMGTAIAFSLSSTKLTAFLVFTALGVGMALPYVVFSSSPYLLKFVPKPGPWMEKLKQFLSFPIFATVTWLIGVYLKQETGSGSPAILYSLLLIFTALWVLKNFTRFSKTIFSIILAFSLFLLMPNRSTPSYAWETYSNKILSKYVGEGRPVFVDFTAEWCLTCKLNKYLVLDSEAVSKKFLEKNVVMLKADWTSVDPEISDAIKSYGRSGVPLNVLYYGEGSAVKDSTHPYIFPSVLTPGMVLDALDKVTKK